MRSVEKYMEFITSKENKTIKYIKKLVSSAAFRREEGRFVAEGLRLCGDALLSGAQVVTAVFSEAFCASNREFVERTAGDCIECLCVRDSIFCALSDTKTPQGVLFVIKTLDKTLDSDTMKKNGHILALENVQDPTNLGTILRSAEALGIDAVVLSRDCCDIYAPKVIRGSMGAVFRLPFMIADDLPTFVREFNRSGRSYAGLSLCALGNEGNGLSREMISACSEKLFIPMAGGAESLNVSAAAAIIIWEMIR